MFPTNIVTICLVNPEIFGDLWQDTGGANVLIDFSLHLLSGSQKSAKNLQSIPHFRTNQLWWRWGQKKRSSPATPAHPRTRDMPVIFSYTLNSWLYISFIYIYWSICYNCVYISYWGYPYDSGNLFLCTPVIWIQQLAMTMFNHWSWIFNGSYGSYKSTVVVNGNQVIQ
jgi:hypothetical protein